VPGRTLYLVRHAETLWNRSGRYQGQTDVPLSEEGYRQARLLASRLARRAGREPFDALWSSDLLRARQTAAVLGEALGLAVRVHPGLREMDFGAWEGLTQAEIERSFPESLEAYRRDPVHARPPGGECFAEVVERVGAAFADILGEEWRRAVVVAHGASLKGWLGTLFGWDPARRRRLLMANTGLTIVKLQGEQARLVTYNDASHLEGAGEEG